MKNVQTDMCINDTSTIITKGEWGNTSYLEFSNNCLDPAAQFRFVDTSAMLNLKRHGCLHPLYTKINKKRFDLLPLWVASVSEIENGNSCHKKYAITQNSWGSLDVQHRMKDNTKTWCAVHKTNQPLSLTQDCDDNQNTRFNFGKFVVSSHTLPFYDIKKKL